MIPKKQKAAQYDPKRKKVVVNIVPVPDLVPQDILVRTTSASLCHSDVTVIQGNFGLGNGEPITIGHEAVGQIVAVGSIAAERGFKNGHHVGFINAYRACFTCEGCKSHYSNCTSGSMVQQGFAAHGFLQEYSAIDSSVAVVLPKELDPTVSSPIFCAGTTAYQGFLAADLRKDEWLAIIGCGGLGQLGIRYAVAMGYKVIGIDIDDATLQTAEESGACYTFNSRNNPSFDQELKEVTSGGCHACIVFAAVRSGYDSAPKTLRIGGTLVPVGITKGNITVSTFDLTMRKYHIRAAANMTRPSDLAECAEFSAKHNITSPSMFFKLEQINEMIDIMLGKRMAGHRLVVKFEDEIPQARL